MHTYAYECYIRLILNKVKNTRILKINLNLILLKSGTFLNNALHFQKDSIHFYLSLHLSLFPFPHLPPLPPLFPPFRPPVLLPSLLFLNHFIVFFSTLVFCLPDFGFLPA